MVVPFPGTLDVILGLAVDAEIRDVVGEDDGDVVLDPFLKALGVVAELTIGRELRDPAELDDEEFGLVPLPKGAGTAPVVLIVAEEFVDPVGADELPDPLPDGEAVLGTPAVDAGLAELAAAAVLANNDKRVPA